MIGNEGAINNLIFVQKYDFIQKECLFRKFRRIRRKYLSFFKKIREELYR